MSKKRPESDFLKPIDTLRQTPSRKRVSSGQGGPGPLALSMSLAAAVGIVAWGTRDTSDKNRGANFDTSSVPDLVGTYVPVEETSSEASGNEETSLKHLEKVELAVLVENSAESVGAVLSEDPTIETPPLP